MSALTLERVSASNRKIPADEVIYAALKAGRDHFEIAAEHGGAPALIRMHIKRKGWDKGEPLLLKTRAWPADAQFIAWIDQGLTYRDMANLCGFHQDTIRQRIRLQGLFDRYLEAQAALALKKHPPAPAPTPAPAPPSGLARVVLPELTLRDGTVIKGPLSLPRVSMVAQWQGKPGWAKDEEGAAC